MYRSIITGSGSYIPEIVVKNSDFLGNEFYSEDGALLDRPSREIVEKFSKITGILERRYAGIGISASDMAAKASELAIENSGINRESIDQLIVAHNFGDMEDAQSHTNIVPSLASRVKKQLGIQNPACIPYDVIFGCPGWLQGVIHADAFFKAGIAKKALVVGTETLSRVIDKHDRDGMIFSDGAGACILEYKETATAAMGILSANVRSDCGEELDFITMHETYKPSAAPEQRYTAVPDQRYTAAPEQRYTAAPDQQYIKMRGRKVYEYALRHVPTAMKDCFDASGCDIRDLKVIFIHQANEKMDEAIIRSFYELYGITDVPVNVMPMCIQWLGNSSVATIPTLLDLVRKEQMDGFRLNKGDIILFASVGAGMNINAVCYGCN